jgi:hypothetical protein
LDETHLDVGSTCYHVSEFMERQTRVGNIYEPIPGQKPKLDILIAEPGQPPRYAEIPMTFAALHKLLGGELEITKQNDRAAFVQGKNGNGILAVCGLNGENLTSLHPYTAQSYKHKLAERPAAANEKAKQTIAERLEAGKQKAAEHNASRLTLGTPHRSAGAAEQS